MTWLSASALSALVVLSSAAPVLAADETVSTNRCEVSSWTMTWGVKESFRAYLSGAIANGEWFTDGDVTYSTPDFVVSGTSGWLGSDGQSGELAANGSISFVGHAGILDQTLSSPSVEISADGATLIFDVEGDTQEGVSVRSEAVPFATATGRVDVNADLTEWRIVQAPTVLTPEGAAAFGTYPAGETLDPVTIEVAVEPGCLTSSGLFAQPLAWVVSGTLLAGALAVAVTAWVRKSRGPTRPSPLES